MRRGYNSCLQNSISGDEKRAYRQSIAPLSPNTGAAGTAGPISSNYRRTSSSLRHVRDNTSVRHVKNRRRSPLPDQSRRDDITRDVNTNQVTANKQQHQLSQPTQPAQQENNKTSHQQSQPSPTQPLQQISTQVNSQEPSPRDESLQQEIIRLKQTLKERDDDVETLIYEVYRLQELSSKVKDANDARSNDFTLLKKEAERLKQDFAERTSKNEEKMKRLSQILQGREQRIFQLEQQLHQSTKTISDLELQLNGMASPSIGVTPNRIPQRQYRATKSYEETKSAAVLGGAPISYRSRSKRQSLNGVDASNAIDRQTDIDGPTNTGMNVELSVEELTTQDGDQQSIDDEFESEKIQAVTTRSAANRYQRPRGIGVGDKGMLENLDDGNAERDP